MPKSRASTRLSLPPAPAMAPMRARLRLSPVLAPLLAGVVVMAAAPAQAEFFFRPFGGVYVERYYEPLPPGGYYPEPPAPVYRAPERFPFTDIEPMLRSMGMRAIGRVRVEGNTYVVDATDPSGTRVRVRIDAFNGRILALAPTGAAPVARQAPVGPPRAATAPLPPRKPPEIAAVTVPAPPPLTGPEAEAGAGSAALPAEAVPAAPAPESGTVRVIPGIATPPGTAPQKAAGDAPAPATEAPGEAQVDAKGDAKTDAKADAAPPEASASETSAPEAPAAAAPSAPSTGTGTGSTTPAGTASVVARDNGKPAPPAD
ncbi:hypothetical protein [Ancylobacter sp. TS-1]|uniref:hypothetical protein n=1 Tax=Ancylobacter sp. TS-1 TaxID=1850374 RepID=UPI001265BF20|nr:hypothetical protein [Ancylobacter sp. TS-1]QFR33103.1 hypothetical protein GBB76_08150 [Ancylobacter sp. TS-1]